MRRTRVDNPEKSNMGISRIIRIEGRLDWVVWMWTKPKEQKYPKVMKRAAGSLV